MINWIKTKLARLFKGKDTNYNTYLNTNRMELDSDNKTIAHMNSLKAGLIKITNAYNKNLANIRHKYNQKVDAYNKAYQHYQDVFKRYTNQALSDAELDKEKAILKQYESDVQEVAETLQEVEGYKAEDVKAYTDEMDSLKDSYTSELADSIINKAYQLQLLRNQYYKTLSEITGLYGEAEQTEKVMNDLNNNIQYRSNIINMINIKTKDAPLHVQDLTIEQHEIIKYLQK